MYINKINGRKYKNLNGLSSSLFYCGTNIIDYLVEFENFKIPKCECGENCKYMTGINFRKTCGNEKCKTNFRKKIKFTDETKELLRQKRYDFLKKKTGKTAWERRSNGDMSYLEKWFHDKCIENNLYSKYDIVNEYSVYPYFIDFAFINEKVAIELDGKIHFINNKRTDHDFKKDDFLIENGWRVFRIRFDEITNNKFNEAINFIGSNLLKNYDSRLYSYKEVIEENKKIKEIEKLKKEELKKELINEKINKVINSNIDFTKLGWVKKVSVILNISHHKTNNWMVKNMKDFYYKNCFIRGSKIKKEKEAIENRKKEYLDKQKELSLLVLNSGINFDEKGWVLKVSKILNRYRGNVYIWMAEFLPDILINSKINISKEKLELTINRFK